MIKVEIEKIYYLKDDDVRKEYDNYVEMCKEIDEEPYSFKEWVKEYLEYEDLDLDYECYKNETKKFKVTVN